MGKNVELVQRTKHEQKLKFDFFGDSDTAAFDGVPLFVNDFPCLRNFQLYENCGASWAAVLASLFGAELSIQAWSGKDVARNAADFVSREKPFPQYFNRTLATWVDDDEGWFGGEHRSNKTAVFILLGSNDWENPAAPGSDEGLKAGFLRAYSAFLAKVRGAYGEGAEIIKVCGGGSSPRETHNNEPCALVREAVEMGGENSHMLEVPLDVVGADSCSCLRHRNAQGQCELAAWLAPRVGAIIGREPLAGGSSTYEDTLQWT